MGGKGLADQFQAYSAWRADIQARIDDFRRWLAGNELADAQVQNRLHNLLERLGEDRLMVAFVAEYSRGKSELINAIFFADYGRRLLPSSSGRTTMCPTELLWDSGHPPSIQLLPIETRARHATTTELKRFPDEWTSIPIDVTSAESLADAFAKVGETRRVPLEEAKHFGLFLAETAEDGALEVVDGLVDIPRWRHAVINFPHPLLSQGLVILDTPGLNAIGSEPELTLNLLPNAHAVLFVLALDTGVSRSDIQIWREHLCSPHARRSSRIVVLNKIDSVWDGIRSEAEIEAEVERQAGHCAAILELEDRRVFPVSAQKAFVARVTADPELLAKSRVLALERALSEELIPGRQDIVRESTRGELSDLLENARSILVARRASVADQLAELNGLRGKNLDIVEEMMRKVRAEKEDFEQGFARFQALRGVFSRHTNRLFIHLGMDALAEEARQTLYEIRRSQFTSGVRAAMNRHFRSVRFRLSEAGQVLAEIQRMMEVMYERFAAEHRLRLGRPTPFSLLRYQKECDRLEQHFRSHFDTPLNMLTHEKMALAEKFFETLASEVKRVYHYANRETEQWLRAVMSPMETQMREHQMMLRRRLESIKRIHAATETLEDRIDELTDMEHNLFVQLAEMERLTMDAVHALERNERPMAAAT
ncbi:MAG: dynamin family protein [Burkholderiales bacterium]